jgi:PKD repeat protein
MHRIVIAEPWGEKVIAEPHAWRNQFASRAVLTSMIVLVVVTSATIGGYGAKDKSSYPPSRASISAYWAEAALDIYPALVQVGASVRLDGRNSTGSYWIENYTWDITDGPDIIQLFGSVVITGFSSAGDYPVSLTVKDYMGEFDSAQGVIHVTRDNVDNPPVAEAGEDFSIPREWAMFFLNGEMCFDDWGIVDYVWTFIDEGRGPQTIFGQYPGYQFSGLGIYDITLTVADSGGMNASDKVTVMVHNSFVPQAEAGPDQTVTVGEEVVFDGTASQDAPLITEYRWTLIDGQPLDLYGAIVKHTFYIEGDYVVGLQVTDSMGMPAFDSMTVHVLGDTNAPPIADAGDDATIEPGTVFQFNGSGSHDDRTGLSYFWTFLYNGTHVIAGGVMPAYKFDIPGTYTVQLTVTDSGGLSASDAMTITVTKGSGPAGVASFLEDYGLLVALALSIVACALVVTIVRDGRKGRNGI